MNRMLATRIDNRFVKGMLIALMAFLAISWWPAYRLPLGDSHEGRVLGQFALHVANFWNLGFVDSSFGASWEPFSQIPYTHHPPLLTYLHLLISTVAGQGLAQIKMVSYVAGLTTVPVLYWVGRRLGLGAFAAFISTVALVATPWWWVYGRLGLGFLPNLLMIGSIWAVLEEPKIRRLRLAGTASFFAVVASWHGVFLAPFLWLWVWRRHRFNRISLRLALPIILGMLLVMIWVVQGGGVGELGDHFDQRTRGNWTWGEFIERQWRFARELLPTWYLIVALPGFIAGLVDIRTRFITTVLAVMVVLFAVIPDQGAWIHDYWNFPILLVLFPGLAVLADRIGTWVIHWLDNRFAGRLTGESRIYAKATVVVLLAVSALFVLAPTSRHNRHFAITAMAGELITETKPALEQTAIWHVPEVPWPTWLAYAWDLPPVALIKASDASNVPDHDLVIVRLDRLPNWLSSTASESTVNTKGRYALLKGSTLQRHIFEVGQ